MHNQMQPTTLGDQMPLTFQSLLLDAGLASKDVRLLRHWPGDGIDPLVVWRRDAALLEAYQSFQRQDRRAYFQAPYWASFAALSGKTLFLGLYAVEILGPVPEGFVDPLRGTPPRHACDLYRTEKLSCLEEYSERLFIDWGASGRAWVQRADRRPKAITELHERYRPPAFPGFTQFLQPLSEVASLPDEWAAVLRASRGIYLLTCPRTQEQYVGKADGEVGFWGRWMDYVASGHGGDVRLRSRDPSDYQVSILEVAGTAATSGDILAMEVLWKRKLTSREMGLNAN